MTAPTPPDDLVLIRSVDDGAQWIRRRVDVWLRSGEGGLFRCFADGVVAHCIPAPDGGPLVVVIASKASNGISASIYGSPFRLYLREIGSVRFELSDDLPAQRPWRPDNRPTEKPCVVSATYTHDGRMVPGRREVVDE